jgi:hypothetical protein
VALRITSNLYSFSGTTVASFPFAFQNSTALFLKDLRSIGVEEDATHRESQELAAGVLAVREDWSPLERVSSGAC